MLLLVFNRGVQDVVELQKRLVDGDQSEDYIDFVCPSIGVYFINIMCQRSLRFYMKS